MVQIETFKRILIIGLGNILFSDEGIGVHITRELEKLDLYKGSHYLDLGTSSWELINHIDIKTQKLIIIDCLQTKNSNPGCVRELEVQDLSQAHDYKLSLHQIKLLDSLKMILIESKLPDTLILGVEPYDAKTISTELSETIKHKFPAIIKSVQESISRFIKG